MKLIIPICQHQGEKTEVKEKSIINTVCAECGAILGLKPIKKMQHLMIDIETLGTKSNSVILSVAAVNFDINTGKTGATFFEKIKLQSSLDLGLKIDADTLEWWLLQKPEALKQSLEGIKNVTEVFVDLFCFVKNLRQEGIVVWGNSNRFDLGLIENAIHKSGTLLPWKHYNERDVRTLVSFAPQIKKQMNFEGKKHSPLDDCYHQIKYCSKIWQILKITKKLI